MSIASRGLDSAARDPVASIHTVVYVWEVDDEVPEVNAPLIVAGSFAVIGAGVHGVGGEVLVIRKLSLGMLPSSPFGGPRMTKTMIHVTWHMTTVAFLTVGVALLLSGSVLHGDAARGIGLVAAAASTGFAALAVGLGGAGLRSPRALFRHPGPVVLTATAALAWLGAL
jgi:hypothetical protein